MSKKKTIVAKNSLWIQAVLKQEFNCMFSPTAEQMIGSNPNSDEYIVVVKSDDITIHSERSPRMFYTVSSEVYQMHYENNSRFDYSVYVDDFINKVRELYRE